MMRDCHFCAGLALLLGLSLASFAMAQPSNPKPAPTEVELKDYFQAKIKAEWDALKSKDKKAYGALLADATPRTGLASTFPINRRIPGS